MANIFVSAHGGRWSTQSKDYQVPGQSTIDFYVDDGGILSNTEGYEIFDQLKQGHEPGGTVVQAVDHGDTTYDYSCWYAEEFPRYCGIFEVGTGNLLMDLAKYSEEHPLLLSDINKKFPDTVVYWVCCREVAHPDADTLHTTAGAWPNME